MQVLLVFREVSCTVCNLEIRDKLLSYLDPAENGSIPKLVEKADHATFMENNWIKHQ